MSVENEVQEKVHKKTTRNKTAPEDIEGMRIVGEEGSIGYDVDFISKFINTVFHSGMLEDDNGGELEHIMFWEVVGGKHPGYPMDITQAVRRLKSSASPRAWYFGTSACVKTGTPPKLYNRKSTFSSLHVVVLDDIGTKVDLADLPDEFKEPSYIIETSPGNFQYGLVLNEPIEDFEQAKALIGLVYASGVSDAGGNMPTKLVRLPCGINGKKGEKGGFKVHAHLLSDRTYTPTEIVNILDVGTTWDDVVANPTMTSKNGAIKGAGASTWNPISEPITTDGAIDVVLDWFDKNNMIHSFGTEWVTVQCPWHREHSSGGDSTAGYSPLGFGLGRLRSVRGFHCFHEHCKERNITTLLDMLAYQELLPYMVGASDPAWQWKTKYVLDTTNSKVVDLTTKRRYPLTSVRTALPHTIPGPKNPIKIIDLLLNSADKITVDGERYEPGATSPIFQGSDGTLRLNTFDAPPHGSGPFDQELANTFIDHVRYLCKEDEEYEYVMNWLVCKAHNPKFRGNAILMYAPKFGTGRDTLARMVGEVFGVSNTVNVSPQVLLDPNYNGFLEHQFVICGELTDGNRGGAHYTAFERLKDLVDPQVKYMQVNKKYVANYTAPIYASFMMFTNHSDALRLAATDRRFYVVTNPSTVRPPEYFVGVHKAMSNPNFAKSVWRWLMTQTPDFDTANTRAPMTAAKEEMILTSGTLEEQVMRAVIDAIGCKVVHPRTVLDIIDNNIPLRDHFADSASGFTKKRMRLAKVMNGFLDTPNRNTPSVRVPTLDGKNESARVKTLTSTADWANADKLTPDQEDDRLIDIETYRDRIRNIIVHPDDFAAELKEQLAKLDA